MVRWYQDLREKHTSNKLKFSNLDNKKLLEQSAIQKCFYFKQHTFHYRRPCKIGYPSCHSRHDQILKRAFGKKLCINGLQKFYHFFGCIHWIEYLCGCIRSMSGFLLTCLFDFFLNFLKAITYQNYIKLTTDFFLCKPMGLERFHPIKSLA